MLLWWSATCFVNKIFTQISAMYILTLNRFPFRVNGFFFVPGGAVEGWRLCVREWKKNRAIDNINIQCRHLYPTGFKKNSLPLSLRGRLNRLEKGKKLMLGLGGKIVGGMRKYEKRNILMKGEQLRIFRSFCESRINLGKSWFDFWLI